MADLSEKELNELYKAVGYVCVCWSNVETLLDICIAIIFQKHSKQYAPKGQIPFSLKTKVKFVRQSLENIVSLKSFKPIGLLLMDRITKISKDRHDMIHGSFSGFDAKHYEFSKIDYLTDIHKFRDLKFTISDFIQAGNTMMGLTTDMLQFCQALLNPFLAP